MEGKSSPMVTGAAYARAVARRAASRAVPSLLDWTGPAAIAWNVAAIAGLALAASRIVAPDLPPGVVPLGLVVFVMVTVLRGCAEINALNVAAGQAAIQAARADPDRDERVAIAVLRATSFDVCGCTISGETVLMSRSGALGAGVETSNLRFDIADAYGLSGDDALALIDALMDAGVAHLVDVQVSETHRTAFANTPGRTGTRLATRWYRLLKLTDLGTRVVRGLRREASRRRARD